MISRQLSEAHERSAFPYLEIIHSPLDSRVWFGNICFRSEKVSVSRTCTDSRGTTEWVRTRQTTSSLCRDPSHTESASSNFFLDFLACKRGEDGLRLKEAAGGWSCFSHFLEL